MAKSSLRWERIERQTTYAALYILLASELLRHFVAAIQTALESGGEITLLAFAMLLVFRIIDERMAEQRGGVTKPRSFADGVALACGGGEVLERVEILADTSGKYCTFIKDANVRIETLRLLVRWGRADGENNQLEDKQENADEATATLRKWQALVASGRIKNFEWGCYRSSPSLHFMLVDGSRCVFGLFRPGKPVATLQSLNFYDSTGAGQSMLKSCQDYFEQLWSEQSHQAPANLAVAASTGSAS